MLVRVADTGPTLLARCARLRHADELIQQMGRHNLELGYRCLLSVTSGGVRGRACNQSGKEVCSSGGTQGEDLSPWRPRESGENGHN
eukprot:scaffold31574_cov124-Isochrysis_galbana.AAC.2